MLLHRYTRDYKITGINLHVAYSVALILVRILSIGVLVFYARAVLFHIGFHRWGFTGMINHCIERQCTILNLPCGVFLIFVGKRDLRLYPYNPLIHSHTYRIAGRELKALSLEAKFIFFQIIFSVRMFSHNASTISRDFTHSDLVHFCKQDCKYPWLEIYLQWFLFHTSYEDNIKQHDIFCCLLAGVSPL